MDGVLLIDAQRLEDGPHLRLNEILVGYSNAIGITNKIPPDPGNDAGRLSEPHHSLDKPAEVIGGRPADHKGVVLARSGP